MKRINKLLALLTILVLALTVMSTSAFAGVEVTPPDAAVTFDKYLVMKDTDYVPTAAFEFSIASGAGVAATEDAPEVFAGVDTAKLSNGTDTDTSVSVQFTPTDTANNTVQAGDIVALGANQQYASKTLSVDFSGVTFLHAGIYRYVITETANADAGILNDANATRYLDVYVNMATNGDLYIAGSTLHVGTEAVVDGEMPSDDKDSGYTNTYGNNDLIISKTVTGNQGNRQQYFKFVVTIASAKETTKYAVDLTNASTSDGNGHDNPTVLEYRDGSCTGTFYMKHGETITIHGLTSSTLYTVVEEDYGDYTVSYLMDEVVVQGDSTPEDGTAMGGEDHTVTFTNDLKGTIPTGVLLEVAPYALVVLLAVAAAVLMIAKKRRSKSR